VSDPTTPTEPAVPAAPAEPAPHYVAQSVVAPGRPPGALSFILNVLWVILSGFWLMMAYFIAGVVLCITIIGIPFGVQSFKLGLFAIWPFGRAVIRTEQRHVALGIVGNVLWFALAGFWLAIGHLMTGIALCVTIVGIPLGLANFKLIPLAIFPFGKTIVRKGDVLGAQLVAAF